MRHPEVTTGTTLAPKTRNPFSGRGLAVCVCLLREPKEWSISALAACAEVSQPFTSMVVRDLRYRGLLEGNVARGRAASIRGTRRLAYEVGLRWPRAHVGVIGTLPDDGPLGGAPAWRAAGLLETGLPIRYVRSQDDLSAMLGWWGGSFTAPEVGQYEVVIADVPMEPGLVPPVIVALELGRTPRGRETLDAHVADLLGALPA